MRFLLSVTVALLGHTALSTAQTPDQVKSDVLAALATPLPITVVGPIITRDVKVTQQGDAFLVTMDKPTLMGIVPMDTLSMKLTPTGEKTYRVTELTLPKTLDILNTAKIGIGGTKFDGLWSTETRSYSQLNFALDKINYAPKNTQDAKVQVGTLALDVAKQGVSGATESKFVLHASDITSKGLPPENIAIKNLNLDLLANGPEPVDLYAVLARFIVLGVTGQGGGDAVMQFAESLRAKSYDNLAIHLAADGVEAIGSAPGSTERLTVGSVTGTANLSKVTPEEWGTMEIAFNGKDIKDKGFAGLKEMNADTGSLVLSGSQIPIQATLGALTRLDSISRGENVSLKVSEILDGLLNIGAIKLSSNANNIVYVPLEKDASSLSVGKYAIEFGADGFRNNTGKLAFASSTEDVNWDVKKFDSEIQKKALQVLNPKKMAYDFTISELNESFLRKLMGDTVINTSDDFVALVAPVATYAMAMKPVLETKNLAYQSAEVDFASSGKLRVYPGWLLGGSAYEGESKLSLKGLDKLLGLLEDLKNAPPDALLPKPTTTEEATTVAPVEPDSNNNAAIDPPPAPSSERTAFTLIQSVLTTMKALAATDGDKLTWSVKYPKAGESLMIVNDTELRFPNIATQLAPYLALGALGRGAF